MSFDKEEKETKETSNDEPKPKNSGVVNELEVLFKQSLEKILIFSKQNESQEPLLREITNLLKDSSIVFEKILKKSSDDDSIILETLTNDIGKYMQIILRLLEENNSFIKGIFLIDTLIKQLQDMICKLKNKLYSKVFIIYIPSLQNLYKKLKNLIYITVIYFTFFFFYFIKSFKKKLFYKF